MQYVDRDGFVWEGAVINCLDCVYLDNIENRGRCNSYDSRANFCQKYKLCEQGIREKFGVGIGHEIECSEWRPRN